MIHFYHILVEIIVTQYVVSLNLVVCGLLYLKRDLRALTKLLFLNLHSANVLHSLLQSMPR